MGVIRKTASIGTLGIINFRSKKEKLRRSEAARAAEHVARETAEHGFAEAKTELRRLTSSEAKASKQLARLRKRSRKVRKADRLEALLNSAQPVMHDGVTMAKKHGKRARRVAERASHEVKRGAERAVDQVREALPTASQ